MNINNNVLMGNVQSISKVTYERVKDISLSNVQALLVCTLTKEKEKYGILRTIPIDNEEDYINKLINRKQYDIVIILYGENMYDEKIITKYNQLKQLGFSNCYVYFGGLFEWFLLQDVYGCELFPTKNTPINGCLDFKPIDSNGILY